MNKEDRDINLGQQLRLQLKQQQNSQYSNKYTHVEKGQKSLFT